MTNEEWLAFEEAVHLDVTASIIKDEQTPLEFGQPIAWNEASMGKTVGFTAIHCVGFPAAGHPYTSCGELIPPPCRWLPLTGAMVYTMKDKCRTCAAAQLRYAKEHAA